MSKRKLEHIEINLSSDVNLSSEINIDRLNKKNIIYNNIIIEYEKKLEYIVSMYENKIKNLMIEHQKELEHQMSLFHTYISDKYNTTDVSYIN